MGNRNKALGIESLTVMIVLIIFAFVVFMVIEAGAGAYDKIVDDKQSTSGARVAYSYISMKVKQHDAAGGVAVEQSDYGDTLRLDMDDTGLCAYIFYAEGALYECIAEPEDGPSVSAANKITHLDDFRISQAGRTLRIECVYEREEGERQVITGAVGLRS